jgi:hypothetical protein
MKDLERITRIISKLEKLWKLQPNTRLGQLVENVKPMNGISLFYMEDDLMEEKIDEEIERLEGKK